MNKVLLYMFIVIMSSCANPTGDIPEQKTIEEPAPAPEPVPEPAENVPEPEPEVVDEEPEYVYTIIGTWYRDFDIHKEYYVFSEFELTTFCDGVKNGEYNIEYTEGWTFVLSDIGVMFDYELLHSDEMDVLILNGYSYRMVR